MTEWPDLEKELAQLGPLFLNEARKGEVAAAAVANAAKCAINSGVTHPMFNFKPFEDAPLNCLGASMTLFCETATPPQRQARGISSTSASTTIDSTVAAQAAAGTPTPPGSASQAPVQVPEGTPVAGAPEAAPHNESQKRQGYAWYAHLADNMQKYLFRDPDTGRIYMVKDKDLSDNQRTLVELGFKAAVHATLTEECMSEDPRKNLAKLANRKIKHDASNLNKGWRQQPKAASKEEAGNAALGGSKAKEQQDWQAALQRAWEEGKAPAEWAALFQRATYVERQKTLKAAAAAIINQRMAATSAAAAPGPGLLEGAPRAASALLRAAPPQTELQAHGNGPPESDAAGSGALPEGCSFMEHGADVGPLQQRLVPQQHQQLFPQARGCGGKMGGSGGGGGGRAKGTKRAPAAAARSRSPCAKKGRGKGAKAVEWDSDSDAGADEEEWQAAAPADDELQRPGETSAAEPRRSGRTQRRAVAGLQG